MKYDVAVSFAGEDRELVFEVVQTLRKFGLEVFYDMFSTTDLFGAKQSSYLANVFGKESFCCVTFISEHYVQKKWTMFELSIALQRENRIGRLYILPIRVDDTEIEQISADRGYIDARKHSVSIIARNIFLKIKELRKKEDAKENRELSQVASTDMTTKKTMSIVNKDGSTEIVEIILAFEFKDNKKEYVVYTKNETDIYGDVTVYVSNVRFGDNGKPELWDVDEQDWDRIKEVLHDFSKEEETVDTNAISYNDGEMDVMIF